MQVENFTISFNADGKERTGDVSRFPVNNGVLTRVYTGPRVGQVFHFWKLDTDPLFYFKRGESFNETAENIKYAIINHDKERE